MEEHSPKIIGEPPNLQRFQKCLHPAPLYGLILLGRFNAFYYPPS